MLNPRWQKFPYKEDLELWYRIQGTLPMSMELRKGDIDRLIQKYYASKSGADLGPGFSGYQTLAILNRTMSELANAVSYHEKESNREWHEQRDKEEDLGARLTRENDLRSDASFRRISLRDEIDIGRFWISPMGECLTPDKDVHHGEWIMSHSDKLNQNERVVAEKFKKDPSEFMNYLFADGWIRISGGVAELSSEEEMYPLAEFLIEHVFGTEKDSSIMILQHDNNKEFPMKIADIIEKYGDAPMELQGNDSMMRIFSSRQVVPNPLRKNLDYGPEWQSRVKEKELHDENFNREGGK